jgi:hypothetical protein
LQNRVVSSASCEILILNQSKSRSTQINYDVDPALFS